jgi:membrane protein YqaA with SNARE-associated domain
VPIFPGETTLNAASVLASQDKLRLELVMLAGALGAVLGDSAVYWLARTGPRKLKARLEAASENDERVYTCLLAYWVGSALGGFPLASMVVSGGVTTILIYGVYWIDRRRHPEEVSLAPSQASGA